MRESVFPRMTDEEKEAYVSQLLQQGLLKESDRLLWDTIQPERLKRMVHILHRRTRYVSVMMEAVDDGRNQSAVLRSADAFGIQDIHVVRGQTPFQPNPYITQRADKWLTIRRYETIASAVDRLQRKGYRVLASHLDDDAVPVHEIDLSEPTVLLFGNEKSGVSEEALEMANGTFVIPMQGFVQSLNVSVAAAITMSHVTQEAKKAAGTRYFLDETEKRNLLRQWLLAAARPQIRKQALKKSGGAGDAG